jgi:hypothetical protein
MFTLDTRDRIRKHRGSTFDYNRNQNEKYTRNRFGWFLSPSTSYTSNTTTDIKVNTVRTDDSEAKVDLKTKLTGDVNIQFRSDVFDLGQMTQILGVTQPEAPPAVASPAAAPAPAAAPPPLPPLPPLPTGR